MKNLLPNAIKKLLRKKDNSAPTEEAVNEPAVESAQDEEAHEVESASPQPAASKTEKQPAKLPVLTRKCIEAAAQMKKLFAVLEKERNVFAKSYIDLKLASYKIKDLAKRGGFPMGVEMASELHDYMDHLKELDDRSVILLKFHLDALVAVFNENRKSNNDQTAQDVINSLRKAR